MTTYISLLRGINVSGKNIIKMDDLKKMYEKLNCKNISTYLQSGNVVFTAEENNKTELETKITGQIKNDFGYEVPVIVLTISDLKQITDNNPFLQEPDKDQTFFHVTFLSGKPENYDPAVITDKKEKGEEIIITEKAVYLYCPNGYGKTKLTNNLIENKLKVGATTRNWKTTTELFRIGISS